MGVGASVAFHMGQVVQSAVREKGEGSWGLWGCGGVWRGAGLWKVGVRQGSCRGR